MKIINNLVQSLGTENKINTKKQAVEKAKSGGAKQFDQIIIDKAQAKPISNQDFAASLAAKVSGELKAPTDGQKLQNIQSQIQRGEYSINGDEIARKMMIGLR